MKPADKIKAHQYLYYVKAAPIWSDYDYDMYCRSHGIEGGGGSDMEDSYSQEVKDYAHKMLARPRDFPATYNLKKAMNYRAKL